MLGRPLQPSAPLHTPAPDREEVVTYARKDVLRLLKIDNRQLRSWERQQLVPALERYRFTDLLLLKRIDGLRRERAPARRIREAQQAIFELLNRDNQSLEDGALAYDAQVYTEGRRVHIKLGKHRFDPRSGQLLLDFSQDEIQKLLHLPATQRDATAIADRLRHKLEADHWFERGLELESAGAPLEQIIQAYTKAAELDPQSAGALVNLGTVLFNGHAWADAEVHYQRALEIDPDYALAHFNLGNLYDEQEDVPNALHHYNEAVRIHPGYADAHYNLALLYQTAQDNLSAVRHWRAYLRLDATSTWAQIARRELTRIERMTVLPGNRPPAAKLQLLKPKSK